MYNVFGGPVFKTEAICYEQIQTVGLPYLKQKQVSFSKILQIKCVNWDGGKQNKKQIPKKEK